MNENLRTIISHPISAGLLLGYGLGATLAGHPTIGIPMIAMGGVLAGNHLAEDWMNNRSQIEGQQR